MKEWPLPLVPFLPRGGAPSGAYPSITQSSPGRICSERYPTIGRGSRRWYVADRPRPWPWSASGTDVQVVRSITCARSAAGRGGRCGATPLAAAAHAGGQRRRDRRRPAGALDRLGHRRPAADPAVDVVALFASAWCAIGCRRSRRPRPSRGMSVRATDVASPSRYQAARPHSAGRPPDSRRPAPHGGGRRLGIRPRGRR